MTETPIIELKGVDKTFRVKPMFGPAREVHALRDVSLALHPGRALALVGESGSGKSTVGRMIAGQHDPSRGQILFQGRDLTAMRRAERRDYHASVQMVFQDPFGSLNPAHTIRHHLMRPLTLHGRGDEAGLRDLLADVELDPDTTLEKYPHQLSGGQRQRVNFARALAVGAKVIVADEPTSMLDVSIRKSVLQLMRRLKDERGLALLYITHDVATAQYLAEDTAVMFAGQVVEAGPTASVVGNPRHAYTRLLRAAIPDPAVRLVAQEDGFADDVEIVRTAAALPVRAMEQAGPGHSYATH